MDDERTMTDVCLNLDQHCHINWLWDTFRRFTKIHKGFIGCGIVVWFDTVMYVTIDIDILFLITELYSAFLIDAVYEVLLVAT